MDKTSILKKYYYVYAYDCDNSDYYEAANYRTEFDWGITEFREIKNEEDICDFRTHIGRLATCKYFKGLISWQELKD